MKQQKFIINNNNLIVGEVEFHEDLLHEANRYLTAGGGRWHIDEETNTIYFYGSSVDFGKVTKEQFENAYKRPNIEAMNIIFSEKEYLCDVMDEQNKK